MERRLAAGHDRRSRLKRKHIWTSKLRRPLKSTRVPAHPGVAAARPFLSNACLRDLRALAQSLTFANSMITYIQYGS
jgi:hypothetical protein